ncbi:MAG: hypothetical protein HRF45_00600 [Fimbriimonadia bacterium]|jgi:hypothetical protein
MNGCEKYRDKLMEYVDGRCDSVGDHVAVCESCRQVVEELRQVQEMLAALPAHRAPDSLAEGVRTRLASRKPVPWALAAWPRLVPAAAVAAVAIAALIALPRINAHQRELAQAQDALYAMKDLHTQVQLAYMLPADSPVAARPTAPVGGTEEYDDLYDDLYDFDGL